MIVDHFYQCTIKCEPNQYIERIKHCSCTTFYNPTKTCKMYQKRLINGFWLHYQFCRFIYQQEIFLLSVCSSRWDPLMGVTYVPSLNFETCYLVYWGGSHVTVGALLLYLVFSLLLSQFQLDFVSFIAISAVLCHCSKTMYVACQNFTLTGPCQLIIFHKQKLLLCFGLSFDQWYHHWWLAHYYSGRFLLIASPR